MIEAQIKHMVYRFLRWRLPKPWNPDNGISYQRPNYAHEPADHDWPTGTNLLDADQAEAMVRYMVDGFSFSHPSAFNVARDIGYAVNPAHGFVPSHMEPVKNIIAQALADARAPQQGEKAEDRIQSATMPECEELIFKICQLLGCRQPTPTTACAINALLTSRLNASFIAGSQRIEAERKALREALEWRPIETAPSTPPAIWVSHEGGMEPCHRRFNKWKNCYTDTVIN